MSAGWTIQLTSKEKKNKFKASLTFPETKMNWMEDRVAECHGGARGEMAQEIGADYLKRHRLSKNSP